MTHSSFDGLKALVTGGASGIGLATARYLSELGAAVVALDLVPAPTEHVVGTVIADVSDAQSVDRAVTEAVNLLGGLDILVNNAGIGAQGTVEDNPDDEWLRVLNINVVGIARVTRAALPISGSPSTPRWSTPARSPPLPASRAGRCTAPAKGPSSRSPWPWRRTT